MFYDNGKGIPGYPAGVRELLSAPRGRVARVSRCCKPKVRIYADAA
jgi:hypothetical protein